MPEKLLHEEFAKKAFVSLRKEGFKGIHTVYAGFNEDFKKYVEGENPFEVTNRRSQEGMIRPVTGRVMLYLPEESLGRRNADEALRAKDLT